jgi:hypothetical protein
MVIRAACVRLSVVIALGLAMPAMAQQDPNHGQGHPPPSGGAPHGTPPPPGGTPPHGPPPGAIAHANYPPPSGEHRPPPGPQYSSNYHGGDYHGGGNHGGGYNGGGYNRYPPNPGAWQHGNWRHEWHDGRYGWWWNTGPSWYSFDAPVYPYPAYPPVLEAVPVSPPAVVVAPPPPPAGGLPPAQFWYFCDSSHAYYPYVSSCNGPWREVPATATR